MHRMRGALVLFLFAVIGFGPGACVRDPKSTPDLGVAEQDTAKPQPPDQPMIGPRTVNGSSVVGRRRSYSEARAACADYNPYRSPHYGDTHVHTARSLDAGIQDTRTTPYQAYLFARGERIGIQPWSPDDPSEERGLTHMLPLSPATAEPDYRATPLRSLQLGRPLDFAMVSDHAEFFGEVRVCGEKGVFEEQVGVLGEGSANGVLNRGYLSLRCASLREDPAAQFVTWNFNYLGAIPTLTIGDEVPRYPLVCGGLTGEECLAAATTTWQETSEAAEAAYDRTEDCEFTSFVGYEYTSTPVSENMHRNVVFRNANVPALPISYMDADTPERLWRTLAEECTPEMGCEALTIPHNSNVSGSRMFRRLKIRSKQGDFTPEYAAMRQRYEPLIEIYQHKGDSECGMNNADELCSFEKFPFNNLIADRFGGLMTGWASEDNFVRYALKRGLQLDASLGVNPFKYGIIAATDTHLGTPGAVNEGNFPGHGGAGGANSDMATQGEPSPGQQGGQAGAGVGKPPTTLTPGLVDSIAFSGGGLTVLWSEENSRDYLFDAMRRREAYGTSGPRITVRFFGGWDLPESMCDDVQYDPTVSALLQGDFVEQGYAKGVPMGGDLAGIPRPEAKPTFAVAALRDPGFSAVDVSSDLYERSTPLQQVHIIKGWVDDDGKVHEKVVAVAGEASGSGDVDLDTCEPTGRGADELCAVWRDQSFEANQRAFYYARVVENPTCRWSWIQCNDWGQGEGIDWDESCRDRASLPEGFRACCRHDQLAGKGGIGAAVDELELGTYPKTVQERAWTSPIWYRPSVE